MIAGVCIGITAFVMGWLEDHLVEYNQKLMEHIIVNSGRDTKEDNLAYIYAPYL